jgi:hypothetical protein
MIPNLEIKEILPFIIVKKKILHWYQFTEKVSDRKNLVDKQTILEILRRISNP